MSGTNPVATYGQTNFTTDTATQYKTKIDSNFIVAQRTVDCFAPRQSNTPAMTVTLDPGFIFKGTTLTEVAAQTTGTITAPVGNPRIDRVVVDRMTGAASVVTGTPAASPTPPAIPTGKVPVCQVLIQTTSTSIANSMITDERAQYALGRGLAGEEGIGQWLKDDGAGNLTLDVNATLKDNGGGKLTTAFFTESPLGSAGTTDLGTAASNIVSITGTTGITSFGSSASAVNPLYFIRFTGALTLTHNATSLILPGGANITTAAGDTAVAKYEGSGNWRVLSYSRANGQAVVASNSSGQLLRRTIYAAGTSGTWNRGTGTNTILAKLWGGGGGLTGNGGNTTFDTLTASGGSAPSGAPGAGGGASGGDINATGQGGGSTNSSGLGGFGGSAAMGGGGGGPSANGGSPGGGAGNTGSGAGFSAGGGGYCEKLYAAPTSASYSVGSGGTGTHTGGGGLIIIEEYS